MYNGRVDWESVEALGQSGIRKGYVAETLSQICSAKEGNMSVQEITVMGRTFVVSKRSPRHSIRVVDARTNKEVLHGMAHSQAVDAFQRASQAATADYLRQSRGW